MKRGEVWWTNFEQSIGGETQKSRPAIVVSNNESNHSLNRIQVIPLTSNINKCYSCETLVNIGNKVNKAMADQITTVSKKRLQNRAGVISKQDIISIERIIKIQLGLS
ncbi:MAG: type II toxin-antitoxin system PemK/MazF family toxin [Legionellales bacterium]|jgi:mRNA interferase MazF